MSKTIVNIVKQVDLVCRNTLNQIEINSNKTSYYRRKKLIRSNRAIKAHITRLSK